MTHFRINFPQTESKKSKNQEASVRLEKMIKPPLSSAGGIKQYCCGKDP